MKKIMKLAIISSFMALGMVAANAQSTNAAATVVLPLHPRTRQAAERWGIGFDGVRVEPPLGYLDMTRLVRAATSVLTDSGGLQKEAYFHRVPCVTLRDETEWVETIEAGWNRLWTVDEYEPRRDIDEYGDGHAADAVVAALGAHLGS